MTNRIAQSRRDYPQRFLSSFRGIGGIFSRRRSFKTQSPQEGRCAMNIWRRSATVFLALFAGFRPGIGNAQPGPPVQDIGSKVRGVFATKCAGCHGPDLAKPRSRPGRQVKRRTRTLQSSAAIESKALQALTAVQAAESAAQTAESAAEAAESAAETAKSAAQTAESAAETAKSAAQTAESAAQTAESAAEAAESAAQTAESAAQTAKSAESTLAAVAGEACLAGPAAYHSPHAGKTDNAAALPSKSAAQAATDARLTGLAAADASLTGLAANSSA
jgi:hypothetical protein